MKLLAISGGPDSMFLLDWYKNKKIIVAHVNYNKRSDSSNDERIVREFCESRNIPFKVLNLKKKAKGNFQSWAREQRYNFFKEIYKEFNCDQLIMAHHRDDFLETAIMQQQSGRTPRYFGIKKYNTIDGMKIFRPFIDLYWKDEILANLEKDKIEYATDSSNAEPIFERNKVRIELAKKTKKEKKSIYKWFRMSNKILVKKFRKVDYLYKKWKQSEYDVKFFKIIKYKEEVVYEYINDGFLSIKLSKGKLESLVEYILSPNGGKKFKLSNDISIIKKDGYLHKA